MVGRGSHDPCAQADMRVLSEVVSRRIDATEPQRRFTRWQNLGSRQCLIASPAVAVRSDLSIPICYSLGGCSRRSRTQVHQASDRFADVRFRIAYLGPDPLVAEAICSGNWASSSRLI